MDDSTKILAVSYGNFSCRLEGFDDSVETMKAVVSYFHELAGHDRFMDMEPQAPDMDTLARLTEEQVGAPVEIEGEGNNVSLRVATADAVDDEAAEDTLAEEIEDTFAEEIEDTPLEEVDLEEDEVIADEADALSDDQDTIVLNTKDDPAVDEDDTDDTADDPQDLADDSVAAKLQRIRAVVGRDDDAETVNDAEDTFAEDLAEPEVATTGSVNPLAQRLADLAKRNAERAAEEAGVVLQLDDEDEDVTAEDLADLEAEFEADDADDDTIAQDAAELSEDETTEDANEDVLQLAPEDLANDAVSETEDSTSDDGPLVLTPDTEVAATKDIDFDLQQEIAEAQREIDEEKEARTKRDDVLDPVDKNMTRIMSQTDERLNEPEGRRHRDAFAQLKAAVAATEAARQLGDPGAAARDKDEVFREDLGALDAEEASDKAVEAVEEATSDVTDAVEDATTQTDVEDTAETEAEAAQDADLEEIAETEPVEPTQKDTAEDAEADAPAPLKLVASQAVQPSSTPLDAASARLRHIAAQKDAGGAPKGGFAEFAAQQGATELADLLEAAAAYIAFVEGDDDFSRPQVMKKVQAASSSEFSREDGLRSFGRLLRQSRIIKLSNGRFQVAEDTRFRPEDKAAQG